MGPRKVSSGVVNQAQAALVVVWPVAGFLHSSKGKGWVFHTMPVLDGLETDMHAASGKTHTPPFLSAFCTAIDCSPHYGIGAAPSLSKCTPFEHIFCLLASFLIWHYSLIWHYRP